MAPKSSGPRSRAQTTEQCISWPRRCEGERSWGLSESRRAKVADNHHLSQVQGPADPGSLARLYKSLVAALSPLFVRS